MRADTTLVISLRAALLLIAACGSKNPGNGSATDGGDGNGSGVSCTGSLCVTDCRSMSKPDTTISGTVFAPNGTLPLYGISVYIPTADPGPLPPGAVCARCSDPLPGNPLLVTTSDASGKFTLLGAPSGDNIPVVITSGKWRRQIVIPHVDACADHPLDASDTSLPRDRTQGDMPRIAITTGSADSLECLARKLGIADTEITNDQRDGHVQLYVGSTGKDHFKAGFAGGSGEKFSPALSLWNSSSKMAGYDILMFSCEGAPYPDNKPQTAMDAVMDYTKNGGRLFLSHWHNVWLEGEQKDRSHGEAEWQALVDWNDNETELAANSSTLIDEIHNRKGPSFAEWMLNVGGSTTRDEIVLQNQAPDPAMPDAPIVSTGRTTCARIPDDQIKNVEQWVKLPDQIQGPPVPGGAPQNFQFTTPVTVEPAQRCGKVVFSDMHVSGTSGDGDYPDSCGSNTLTPQEKALAFMFFDIATCVGTIL
jgi:hypothetical protein